MGDNLFYAYARRTDHERFSRYILIFASSSVAEEWWSLVQSEYPKDAVRNGPQLFSFQGDDFPAKPANNKKFDHLKTSWFYAQFGDATGTGGRAMSIIPVQDASGGVVNGGGAGGGSAGDGVSSFGAEDLSKHFKNIGDAMKESSSQMKVFTQRQTGGQGQVKTSSQRHSSGGGQSTGQDNSRIEELLEKLLEAQSGGPDTGGSTGQDNARIEELLQKLIQMQSTSQKNNEPIATRMEMMTEKLVELQTAAQKNNNQSIGQDTSRMEELLDKLVQVQVDGQKNIHAAVQQSNSHLVKLNASYKSNMERMEALAKTNTQQIKELKESQSKLLAALETMAKDKAGGKAEGGDCNVHHLSPPPRKINRQVVGYQYGKGDNKPPITRDSSATSASSRRTGPSRQNSTVQG